MEKGRASRKSSKYRDHSTTAVPGCLYWPITDYLLLGKSYIDRSSTHTYITVTLIKYVTPFMPIVHLVGPAA
jgi:hypothetical protein